MREWWAARSGKQKAGLIIAALFVLRVITPSSSPSETASSPPTTEVETVAAVTSTAPAVAPTTTAPPTTTAQRSTTTSTTRATAPSGYSESDVEYQLAVIDAGGFLPTDDESIDRYDDVLDRLASKCGDARRMVGDMAVRGTQLLDDEGISATALELLEGVDIATSNIDKQDSCASIFATLLLLMIEG